MIWAIALTTPVSLISLRRPAAAQASVRLALSALGGDGRRWWFLNGRPLGDSGVEHVLTTSLEAAGRYELSVLDESGQTARVEFSVVE